MAIWDDLISDIYSLTRRPDLVTETAIALRQAVRQAHKSGTYWRDLVSVPVANLDVSVAIQQIDLASQLPNLRHICYVKSGTTDKYYNGATASDLLDPDGYYKPDVYWGFGSSLNIRACAPEASYEIAYFKYPTVTPTSAFDSWIATLYPDLLTLWAGSSVLNTVGETEIQAKLQQLAVIEFNNLQADNLDITGR